MKCCPLSERQSAPRQPLPAAREAATAFAALFVRIALAPMAKPLGFFGDAVIGEVAIEMERHDRSALEGLFERLARR